MEVEILHHLQHALGLCGDAAAHPDLLEATLLSSPEVMHFRLTFSNIISKFKHTCKKCLNHAKPTNLRRKTTKRM